MKPLQEYRYSVKSKLSREGEENPTNAHNSKATMAACVDHIEGDLRKLRRKVSQQFNEISFISGI